MLTHALPSSFLQGTPRDVTAREWPFTECLAIALVSSVVKKSADGHHSLVYVKGIKARFEHTSECIIARPIAAPVLRLHPVVREQAAQLLRMNVRATQVLYENMQLLSRDFDGAIATDQHRLLLDAQVRVICARVKIYFE
jgi:hypothetical protein